MLIKKGTFTKNQNQCIITERQCYFTDWGCDTDCYK